MGLVRCFYFLAISRCGCVFRTFYVYWAGLPGIGSFLPFGPVCPCESFADFAVVFWFLWCVVV